TPLNMDIFRQKATVAAVLIFDRTGTRLAMRPPDPTDPGEFAEEGILLHSIGLDEPLRGGILVRHTKNTLTIQVISQTRDEAVAVSSAAIATVIGERPVGELVVESPTTVSPYVTPCLLDRQWKVAAATGLAVLVSGLVAFLPWPMTRIPAGG